MLAICSSTAASSSSEKSCTGFGPAPDSFPTIPHLPSQNVILRRQRRRSLLPRCHIQSGKCFCSPAAPWRQQGKIEHGTPLPVSCGCCASRQRRTAPLLASRSRSFRNCRSREPLTQGSRSAVEARRSVTRITRWEALHLPACWRDGRSRRPSRTPSRCLTRSKIARKAHRPGVRAYVTSGEPLVTTRAQRGAGAQRPHTTACGELKARGARAARRSRAHAPHVGGALGVGFGEWPATPALFCRRPAAQG